MKRITVGTQEESIHLLDLGFATGECDGVAVGWPGVVAAVGVLVVVGALALATRLVVGDGRRALVVHRDHVGLVAPVLAVLLSLAGVRVAQQWPSSCRLRPRVGRWWCCPVRGRWLLIVRNDNEDDEGNDENKCQTEQAPKYDCPCSER